jgi:hypothetical protein
MRLPSMNGNDFIRAAAGRLRDCLFIVHTGSMEYELPDDFPALGIGMGQVVAKPVADMSVFLDLIRGRERIRKEP